MVKVSITALEDNDITFQKKEGDVPEQLGSVNLYLVDSKAKEVADEIYRQLGLLPSLEPSSLDSLVDAGTVTNS